MRISHTLYFDHQSTTPVDERVLQKMVPYFREKAGNPHSSDHCVGWEASRAVEDAANSIARLIGADADEIIFTSGATEANNLALLGLAKHESTSKRRRVLVSAIEHKSILAVTQVLKQQFGYQIDYLPADKEGRVSVTALENKLDSDVLAVSIMAVNNEIGTIQNVRDLTEATHNTGAVFHCDGAQAPVAMDLGNIAQDVDLLSLSGHKMYGPQGVGVLYARRDLHGHIEPLIYGGGQQKGLRSGTIPVPLCVGMGVAAALLNTDEATKERGCLQNRRDTFVQKLMTLPWPIELNGPKGLDRHPGNANVCFLGFSAHDILATLQPRLAASTGSACTSGIPETSHVLRAINLSDRNAEASIRFSLGRSTTDQDVNDAIDLIENCLEKLFSTNLYERGGRKAKSQPG